MTLNIQRIKADTLDPRIIVLDIFKDEVGDVYAESNVKQFIGKQQVELNSGVPVVNGIEVHCGIGWEYLYNR